MKSVKVELPHLTQPKGGHILHEKECNAGHGIQAIPNEICGEIRGQPNQPEVQQEPVLYLLLEETLGRKCGVPGLPVQTSSHPFKPAYRRGAEADPRYAPPRPAAWPGGSVAPPEAAQLHPPPREPVSSHV